MYTHPELQARDAALSALSPLQFVLEQLPIADVLSLISRFYRHSYDLNEAWARSKCGRPLQHCCANAKDPDKLRAAFLLLDLGANPSLPERPFKSNIVRALENEAWDLYDRLLHHPSTRANDRDNQNRSLLHYLAAVGATTRISELIDTLHDVDVNVQDGDGYTPLHRAIYADRADMVRELLRVPGIRLEFTDHNGRTPLSTATYWGMKQMALVLIEHPGAFKVVEGDRSSPLIAAAIHGQQALCMRLLEACRYENLDSQQDLSGKRLLHHFAKNDWASMISDCLRLVEPPLRVDAIDHAGRSPLHYAAALGNTDCCASLLAGGANLRLQDRLGMTAAQAAADSGFKDTLMLLLQTGKVDANQRDHLGRNIVHWAATLDCLDVIHEIARANGIRWGQRDNYGKRPVDIAYICQSKHVGLLLARKTGSTTAYNWDWMYNSPFVDPPAEGDNFEPHVFGMSVEITEEVIINRGGRNMGVDPSTLPVILMRDSWNETTGRTSRTLERSLSLNRDVSWDRFMSQDADTPLWKKKTVRSQSMMPRRIWRTFSSRFWDEGMHWDSAMCWERNGMCTPSHSPNRDQSITSLIERAARSQSQRRAWEARRRKLLPLVRRTESMEQVVRWDRHRYAFDRRIRDREAARQEEEAWRGRTMRRAGDTSSGRSSTITSSEGSIADF